MILRARMRQPMTNKLTLFAVSVPLHAAPRVY